MLDVAILGGGVAGLALALGLRRLGIDAVVFERAPAYDPDAGKGFLLMPNGLEALAELDLVGGIRAAGSCALRAIHRSPADDVLRDVVIPEHLGILRGTVVDALLDALPPHVVRTGMTFTGFEGSGRKRLACFENGERVMARAFVGADGINSQVRRALFGEPRQTMTPVRELVATLHVPQLVARYAGLLYKIEDRSRRRLLGLFAIGRDHLLWYLRWHRRDTGLVDLGQRALETCARELTEDWPQPAGTLVAQTDFRRAVVLDSVLVELPPRFAEDNVVLIGDAAHPVVRLTTQGANSALEDAVVLAQLLATCRGRVEQALETFSTTRRAELHEVVEDGRRQVDAFRHRQDPHAPAEDQAETARIALEQLATWRDQRVDAESDSASV